MKKTYEVKVKEPYFTYIKNGTKKVEGRLNKGEFLEMRVGDLILTNGILMLEILNISIYKTFREMIQQEGIKNVIPDANSLDEAESVYYNFYTKTEEEKFGVIAIQIKILS
jgi:ASC-1-like (ASCH) protein